MGGEFLEQYLAYASKCYHVKWKCGITCLDIQYGFQNNNPYHRRKKKPHNFLVLLSTDGLQADREADGTEGVDEDMIVTQSQTNFICPITQVEMKKPVKNKVCGHTYEEEAIVRMIESKHKRKKKACCPKIGCSHTDVRMSDLIQDEALRRAIESHNKKKNRPPE
ncbi:E3 SUMO-protein ligase NSE2-like [Leptonychotes weddellii]|uniref:E3 SUMO-protein ligase NSE2 n=1 Tax=Leptonychotes weddellii TaxID=9713 RepID=A0A7F8QA60_LEPWE|nr:E3 SUMO-protein ligase NSE2-like [Leptonychotes weddellii]